MRKIYKVDGVQGRKPNRLKKFMVHSLIYVNVLLAGAVLGGYQGYQYAQGQAHSTDQAIQAALKSVPVAQATSPK